MDSDREITRALREAYNERAQERDKQTLVSWKSAVRQEFLLLLQQQELTNLLEVGAGPGHDSLYFQQQGLSVISTDLSPEMVRLCRAKGLEAYEMNLLDMDFNDDLFDAVYAFNCLLHIPKPRLSDALREIRRVLRPGGLFFLGLHGGVERDGPWEDDTYRPKRHFSLYTDEQIVQHVAEYFQVRDFKAVPTNNNREPDMHFQRLILE